MNLTTKQKAYLRGLGQGLRAQLHLGHEGFTPGVQSALEDLFRSRELVKVRILKSAEEDPRETAEAMGAAAHASVVGVVGKTFVLYRPNPELKERIELPDPNPGPAEADAPARRHRPGGARGGRRP
jgi:RNA-binding protein